MKVQLKECRKAAGIKSQRAMAALLGIPERTYASWERGEANMSFPQAIACANIFGCTLDELAGRESPPAYADPGEARLIKDYRQLNKESRGALEEFAESYAKDPKRRIIKDSAEVVDDTGMASIG